jgi:Secretion system C-terminal sorting domain
MRYLFLSTLLLSTFSAFAQLVEVPLNYNKTLAKAHTTTENTANNAQKRLTTLTLPFIDDFSYNNVYPTDFLWETKHAWINRGMGIKPPTVGVATLDGLKANGLPYTWLTIANNGLDTLRSRPIDLSNFAGSDSIYLSFFYQPGGNGDMPEASDKLLLDFKNNADVWVNQRTFSGQTGNVPAFKSVSVVISAAAFLHPNFQFRLRNTGNARGARDHWHIDYVKIAQNRRWDEPFFNDVAFYDTPVSPFLNYTAMPYKHFSALTPAQTMSPDVVFKVWNHFNTPYSPNVSIVVDEQYSNTTILPQQTPFLSPIVQGRDTVINKTIAVSNYDFTALPQNTDSALLRVRYLFSITGQDNLTNQPNFPQQNDTVTRILPLRDYFAYDDGSAETALITQSIGTRAAIKFRALVADSLQGVQLHVPAFDTDVQSQLFDFEVYLNDLNTTPVFTQTGLRPRYGDSLQYWTSYPFFNNAVGQRPPFIPANTDFYIVWRQASTAVAVPIGLDRNTPANAQFLYQNTGNGWTPIGANVRGALMMRPYMGNKRFTNNEKIALQNNVLFAVSPNPTANILNINTNIENFDLYNYRIINSLGQIIEQGALANTINVQHLPQGVYFLQCAAKGKVGEGQTVRFVKM